MNTFSQRVLNLLNEIDRVIPIPLEAQEETLIEQLEEELALVEQVSADLKKYFCTAKPTVIIDDFTFRGKETPFLRLPDYRKQRVIDALVRKGWTAYATQAGNLVVTAQPVSLEAVVNELAEELAKSKV